jgi:hypothetical protein
MARKKDKLDNIDKKPIRTDTERPQRIRKYKHIFLIVCEDEKTEPEYFSQFVSLFPPETLFLKPVGSGRDPLGVVENAVTEKAKLGEEARKEVDSVWVIFDRDDAHLQKSTIKRFEDALITAKRKGFKVAYSNEVFELWLLLHLEDIHCSHCEDAIHPPIFRNDVYERLEKAIRRHPNYNSYGYNHRKPQKGQISMVEIIKEIGNESTAIERAEILLETKRDVPEILANPSTKVHLLVKEIRKWIDYFSYNPKTE